VSDSYAVTIDLDALQERLRPKDCATFTRDDLLKRLRQMGFAETRWPSVACGRARLSFGS
jgi:hypothetical protein